MKTALIAFVLAVGCGGKPATKTPPPDDRPLFDRLGGKPAIAAVVHEFVATTGADPRISQYFMNTDKPKLEAAMDDHICSITGGNCTYSGKTMLAAHTGMKLRPEDFEAFMDDLGKTLAKLNVPARETGEVIAAFRSMQADVVGH